MNVFEMVVLIVIVSCGAGVVNNWLKSRGKVDRSELEAQLSDRTAQLEKLEQRMRVLERIITDRKYNLKEELHDLESQ